MGIGRLGPDLLRFPPRACLCPLLPKECKLLTLTDLLLLICGINLLAGAWTFDHIAPFIGVSLIGAAFIGYALGPSAAARRLERDVASLCEHVRGDCQVTTVWEKDSYHLVAVLISSRDAGLVDVQLTTSEEGQSDAQA